MIDLIGLAAGLFVILAFHARSQFLLRKFAIASNLLFLVYALEMELWPIFLLHAVLLFLNLARLSELAVRPGAPWTGQMTDEERELFRRGLTLQRDNCWVLYR